MALSSYAAAAASLTGLRSSSTAARDRIVFDLSEMPLYQARPSDDGRSLTLDFADRDAAFRFLDALRLVHRATNLFDNRTLAIHPASTIFGLFTPEQRAAMQVRETTVRLSIGLEDVDDLREDFEQALAAAVSVAAQA